MAKLSLDDLSLNGYFHFPCFNPLADELLKMVEKLATATTDPEFGDRVMPRAAVRNATCLCVHTLTEQNV